MIHYRFVIALVAAGFMLNSLQAATKPNQTKPNQLKQNRPQKHTQKLIKGETYRLQRNQPNYIQLASKNAAALVSCPPPPQPNLTTIIPPQNPNALPGAFYPNPGASNSLTPPPQIVSLTFQAGRQGTQPSFNGQPPDTCGAKGRTQYVVSDNNGITSFDEEGLPDGFIDDETAVLSNADGDFSLYLTSGDERIRYDVHSDRYYAITMIRDRRVAGLRQNFGIALAISDSGTISDETKWTIVNVFNQDVIPSPDIPGCPGDIDTGIDFPSMAIDKDAVYVAVSIFDNTFSFEISATLLVFQKSSLLNGGPVVATAFRDVLGFPPNQAPYRFPTAMQPAMNFDTDSEFGYVITVDPNMLGRLSFFRVIDPGSESPSITSLMPIDVMTTGVADATTPGAYPPFQGNIYGDIGRISAIDDRLQMAHVINNQLFAAHNIYVNANGIGIINGDREAARWYQFDVTGDSSGQGSNQELATTVPALVQAGTLFDPSPSNPLFYSFSAIMSNKRGDVTISSTVSGNNFPPSASYTGRLASDPLGTLRIGTTPPSVYAVGSGTYTRGLGNGNVGTNTGLPLLGQRWGDMSYTSLDPNDQMTMWTIQEYIVNGVFARSVAKLEAP